MKLATYIFRGTPSFGIVTERGICDAPACWPDGPASILEALEGGGAAMRQLAELPARCENFIPLADVRLLAPIPNPPKLLGLAVNYLEHHRELDRGQDMPDDPKLTTTPRPFLMPATAVANPGDEIPWPAYSRQIDYEIELAVVIGSRAKDVSPQAAGHHIAGYTIANDVSARSATFAQGRAQRPRDEFFDWLHGKWADGFCPLGPWLVTADEMGDVRDLELELTVNGATRQKARTSAMIFDAYETVSFCSHLMTLLPGDVIATGTPSGVGAADGRFLAAGDVITCRIEKIGELTNTLGKPPKSFYTPCRT
ncbi:MAG: fumarylacetoacetate hydrolase family protein [Phycisphaerae bacterium]|jgi:2-keto-4-pentenoate hydratase/2-oxohepta-3-ene-1,7-dioic acid hydratase in catechol pathway